MGMKITHLVLLMLMGQIDASIRIGLKTIPYIKNNRFNSTLLETMKNRVDLKSIGMVYYATIGIGKPTQKFAVIFDTGSADLFVPSTMGWKVEEAKKYDSSKSLTYIPNGEPAQLTYPTTSVIGILSQDDIIVGDVTIEKQTFVEATQELGSQFEFLNYDGVLGLAFQEASARSIAPIWYKILEQDGVEKKIFSMWLKYFDRDDDENGVVIFGGFNSDHFIGDHTYVPLSVTAPKYFWEFDMGEIIIGGRKTGYCVEGCSAIVDSGDTEIRGPSVVITKINRAIGVKNNLVDCEKLSSLPRIYFTIGERVFALSSKDYIRQSAAQCQTIFVVNNAPEDIQANNGWILGVPFLRRVHIIFDYENEKIGFADAVQVGGE